MFEKSIFSVVATPASSILIRFKKKTTKKQKKTKKKKKQLCPVTVLVDSQVSDRCPGLLVIFRSLSETLPFTCKPSIGSPSDFVLEFPV